MAKISKEYPKDIWVSKNMYQTASIAGEMVLSRSKDDKSPAPQHDTPLSRFILTLLDTRKPKGEQSVFANIPVNDVPNICNRSDDLRRIGLQETRATKRPNTVVENTDNGKNLAFKEMFPSTWTGTWGNRYKNKTPGEIAQADPANAVNALMTGYSLVMSDPKANLNLMDAINDALKRLKTGTLMQGDNMEEDKKLAASKTLMGQNAGKTPMDILSEPDAINKLEYNRNFLAKNLAKYPKNAELIQAIDAAIRIAKAGGLPETGPGESGSTSIGVEYLYRTKYKSLKNRTQNGKTFCYDVEISWHFGQDYPVHIKVRNYYAILNEKENGARTVNSRSEEGTQEQTMRLSEADWDWAVYQMRRMMRIFEHANAAETLRDIEATVKANIARQKEKQAGQTMAQTSKAMQQTPPMVPQQLKHPSMQEWANRQQTGKAGEQPAQQVGWIPPYKANA